MCMFLISTYILFFLFCAVHPTPKVVGFSHICCKKPMKKSVIITIKVFENNLYIRCPFYAIKYCCTLNLQIEKAPHRVVSRKELFG